MKPVSLVREGSDKVVAVACGACGRVYGLNDPFAERCCDPKCSDCGNPPRKGWVLCDTCHGTKQRAAEAARLAKAVRVAEADYSGPVYFDGAWNEGYLRDTDDFRDYWDTNHDESEPLPAEVWACTSRRLQLPHADDLIERATEDEYEGACDDMPPTGELQAAIDAYNARVTAIAYELDHSRRVVLAPVVSAGPVTRTEE